ncbi:MAG: sigma 54-interacting transcriptional regulator [Nitrospiraceae bacterium]|nr:sigma 54-interacting transcriptional regulator [Nitrospiraceae bacterium]
MNGKIVLLVPGERAEKLRPTPLDERVPADFIHANALNTVLAEAWIQEAPPMTAWAAALILSGIGTWLLLIAAGWWGAIGVLSIALSYIALVVSALWFGGLILPVSVPLAALAPAFGGTTLWMHHTADRRIRLLEDRMQKIREDLAAAREALVCRESVVEGLEEDLEFARAAVTRSAGKEQELIRSAEELRGLLSEAQAHEETTRRRLQELEHQLVGLRTANGQIGELRDAEQERLRQECEQMEIVSRDPGVLSVFRDLKKASRAPLPVLILGEPGTGKELFARAAHRLSARAGRPFVPVNMGAISPELFESELFGHVKGSFTGALADRKGYFELAHEGTIFLDEIGDLRLDHQGKLLRVLQNKTFYRVGDTN